MKRYLAIAAGTMVLALAGCGGTRQDQPAPEATTASAAPDTAEVAPSEAGGKPPASFAQCASCHSVKPGVSGIGPSLAGVFGRKAGTGPGFEYSAALKNSGLTWDEAGLDKWLANPMAMVPGTRMTYAGQGDAAKRAELIAYIKTLK